MERHRQVCRRLHVKEELSVSPDKRGLTPASRRTRVLLATHARDSPLAKALGKDFKGKISLVICLAALPLAFVHPWIACGLYVLVAAIWLCPDRRFEKLLAESKA